MSNLLAITGNVSLADLEAENELSSFRQDRDFANEKLKITELPP